VGEAATLWRVLASEALAEAADDDDGDGKRTEATDAYRVALASLLQVAALEQRGEGLNSPAEIAQQPQQPPPLPLAHLESVTAYWADTHANFIKSHLQSGDLRFLRGLPAQAAVCYLRAGVAGLPSLLALALLRGDAGGALAVVGAAWQLTHPSRVAVDPTAAREGHENAPLPSAAEALSSATAAERLMRWWRSGTCSVRTLPHLPKPHLGPSPEPRVG
jgi:hypothetical protein